MASAEHDVKVKGATYTVAWYSSGERKGYNVFTSTGKQAKNLATRAAAIAAFEAYAESQVTPKQRETIQKAKTMSRKLTIEIDLGNAAFDDMPGYEVARILKKFAVDMMEETECFEHRLHDYNGNCVGLARVVEG